MKYFKIQSTLCRLPSREWMCKLKQVYVSLDLVQRSSDGTSDDRAAPPKRLCSGQKGTPVRYRRTAFVADRGGNGLE